MLSTVSSQIIELGVSYDQEYVNNFPNEEAAKDHINEMMESVNCIYDNLSITKDAFFSVVGFRKINVNGTNTTTFARRLRATAFWYYQQDLCNKVDAAIHITGLGLDGNEGQASGSICNLTLNGGCAIAEFQGITSVNKNANIIAHELGHMLISSSHESGTICSNNNATRGLMCDFVQDLECNKYTLSPEFAAMYKTGLERPCIGEENTSIIDRNCPNCSDFVTISDLAGDTQYVNFGCSPSDNLFDISTTISNKCDIPRNFTVEITYNSNYIEFVDIDNDFIVAPYTGTNAQYNSVLFLPSSLLAKGEGDINMGHVKVKGSGVIGAQSNNTLVNVVYRIDPASKIKKPNENNPFPDLTNIWNILFEFRYPHQLDKSNLPLVKASQLTHDNPLGVGGQDPLNFCSNIKYDIYINGLFEVDINQSYCNTNFFFGPDAKVVVNSGKTLTLTNCKLTTCGDGEKWQGIELGAGANIILDKTTLEKAKTGVLSEFATSSISVKNKSLITLCETGLRIVNASLYPLENSTFSNNSIAINLTNSPIVSASKCTFNMNFVGISALNTNIISTSDFTGNSSAKGIRHDAIGAHELFVPEGKFNNLGQGIISNNGRLIVGNSIALKPEFKSNQMGIFKGNAPLLVNIIKSSIFDENQYGVLISQSNGQGNLSYINGQCRFTNNKYGVSIGNSLGKGWLINNNTFEVPYVGIKTSKSDKVDIDNNTFTAMTNSRFGSAKDMVTIEGGRDNKVHDNNMTHLSNSSESAQMRNIYVANANNTQVHCNILNNGTYGLNVWGAAPSIISANTIKGNHTGLYYGLYPNDGNVATGPQSNHGNIWEKNPPFISTFGAKHLGTLPLNVDESRYIVDEIENPKFNTSFSSVTNWIRNNFDPANSSNCANPPLSGTSSNASGGNSGSGSNGGSGSGGTMALSISNGDVPFSDYSVSLNQALDQQLYTSVLNGDNTGLNTNQINSYSSTMYNTLGGTLAQANYLLLQPITGSTQVSTYTDQIHTLMEAYYTAETNNDPNASSIRSQINDLSATLSSAYGTYLTNLYNRIDQVQANISPLLSISDPYIYAQANVMQLNLRQLKGDSLNAGDITKLTQIANMCPLEGGDAVYGARGILESVTLIDISYNDNQLCVSSTPRSKLNNEEQYIIYPNPAISIINISNSNSIKELSIIDNMGKLISKFDNHQGLLDLSIPVKHIEAGIYFIKIQDQENRQSVHKVIIIK